jgi:hydrogenase maturation protein HypF
VSGDRKRGAPEDGIRYGATAEARSSEGCATRAPSQEARTVRIAGVVQGVGFRPHVYRLAHRHGLTGWVLNGEEGVTLHLEGRSGAIAALLHELETAPPPAARIAHLESEPAPVEGHTRFEIRSSERRERPTVRIAPDLPVCDACLAEMRDPDARRRGYPYISCTDCGPRYSIVLGLPYDRPLTTMHAWPLCAACEREYRDPLDRRFHAQPLACPDCGPTVHLHRREAGEGGFSAPVAGGGAAIRQAAALLRGGAIVAVKGLGGYHLACDARSAGAVAALRRRKFRKEKPFALMARDPAVARAAVELSADAEALLTSIARPIVLAPARTELPHVAPDNSDLGVMLPTTPLQHLLFDAGAPALLVMTSGNRSSEPIAFRDGDAFERLAGLADAILIGERGIARRLDDSIAADTALGPTLLRRSRGYAPSAVAELPGDRPLLALGGDLKSSVTLVVGGQAFVSQHLGDLEHRAAFESFCATVADLTRMYEVDPAEALVVYDLHPEYRSSRFARDLPAAARVAVQHHRAHIASVLAERGALERRVLGVAFDGTGYGDDGAIWGGELFVGSVASGLARAAHLAPAALPGGDAAARHPVQAAAGFLLPLATPDLEAPPFDLPPRYRQARALAASGLRTFTTTSVGRLLDTAAALLGFTRAITFEGQAAIRLEQLARGGTDRGYPLPFADGLIDHAPLLTALMEDRLRGLPEADLAHSVHEALARTVARAGRQLCEAHDLDTVALSGGVFQNRLLLALLERAFAGSGLALWVQREVPPNDGGLSLGQAALASVRTDATSADP